MSAMVWEPLGSRSLFIKREASLAEMKLRCHKITPRLQQNVDRHLHTRCAFRGSVSGAIGISRKLCCTASEGRADRTLSTFMGEMGEADRAPSHWPLRVAEMEQPAGHKDLLRWRVYLFVPHATSWHLFLSLLQPPGPCQRAQRTSQLPKYKQ